MKKILLVLALGAIVVCCSKNGNEPEVTPPSMEVKIPINISTAIWTRATDLSFEAGDQAGIYVVNYTNGSAPVLAVSGNHVDNMRFTYTTQWSPDFYIYWKDQTTKADFYCYYPYTSSITSVLAYPFSVKTSQNIEADYKASDFLWGKAANIIPSSDPVQITTKHVMSNLLIYLEAGMGYTAETLKTAVKSIKVCNTKTNSTINLATGVASAEGSVVDITPQAEADYYRALIVPQSVSNVDLIEIAIGDEIYTLRQTITFEANKQHKCTLIVNRTGAGINIGIGGWDKDDTENGGIVK